MGAGTLVSKAIKNNPAAAASDAQKQGIKKIQSETGKSVSDARTQYEASI